MSSVISTHIRPIQIIRYVEDFHKGGYAYNSDVKDAVNKLWGSFSHRMDDPYNISLTEIMVLLSEAYQDGICENDILDMISQEVDEIFDESGATPSNELSYHYYLLCSVLFDYLVEEEGINEMNTDPIELVCVKHNRIDITFK